MDEHLNELLEREPFHAFKIVTSGGKEYEVMDPRSVAVGERHIFIFGKRDKSILIRTALITSIETTQDAA